MDAISHHTTELPHCHSPIFRENPALKGRTRCSISRPQTGSHRAASDVTTSTVSPSTGSSVGNDSRSDVQCGQENIQAEIPVGLLGGSDDVGEYSLEDPDCTLSVRHGKLTAQFGFSQCGTTVQFEDNAIIYRNFITIKKSGESVPITCEYPRKRSLSLSYHPVQRNVRFYERNLGTLEMSMKQYTSASFQTEVPSADYPINVNTDEPVYIQVRAERKLGSLLSVFPASCLATGSPSPIDATVSRQLIREGCKKDPSVVIYPANGELRFSFNAFSLTPQTSVVYIHCEILVCNANDLSSRCSQGCRESGSGRAKRSLTAADHSGHFVSGGPMVLNSKGSSAESSLVTVLAAVAGVSMLVAVMAVIVAGVTVRMRRIELKPDNAH